MMHTQRLVGLIVLAAMVCVMSHVASGEIDFTRDIRPILSDNCFKCHGPDEGERAGGFRLDTREAALAEADSGEEPLVPGDAAESEVIKRITSGDETLRMPPADSGKTLTPEQIEKLRVWIDSGAEYKLHWAFVPPVRPVLPQVVDKDWPANDIDRYILARLEREALRPSPQASPETRLRRLSLDLIGLPPTPEEIETFLADPSPQGYGRQVERLLASPHYGERWGRVWLDAARYADSDGFEKDLPRDVWMYRDWVVGAMNRDLPYDQFVIEQLAGDLLPDATQDQHVATGFLRNSMINEEGGIDPEQFRMEAMFDRMDAIGKSVLGLTIQCAQCHTHKFDPISHEEYYQVFAYLNDTHEACIAVYTPEEEQQRVILLEQIAAIENGLKREHPDWRDRMALWEANVRADQEERPPQWHVVPIRNVDQSGQKFLENDDGSITAWGYSPVNTNGTFVGSAELPRVTGFRLEALNDPQLPWGGPGRSMIGLFGLTEFEVTVTDPAKISEPQRVKFKAAAADFSNPDQRINPAWDVDEKDETKKRFTGSVEYAIDGRKETAWGIDAGPGRRNVARHAVFVPEAPLELSPGSVLRFNLAQNHGGQNGNERLSNNLGRFRISITSAENPQADLVPPVVRQIFAIPAEERTDEQHNTIFTYWRTTVPEWEQANARIDALWQQHPAGTTQLTLAAREQPRKSHLLARGDFLKPEQEVEPGVPDVLHPLPPDAPANRLGLAKWVTARNSPTTARSLVNRVWQAYFGTGLVSTTEDLGVQSEPPSHPVLLDWLAVEFMDEGWSLKHLHRLIVLSATYQQSSRMSPELLERDPANRLLARGPRFRVTGEGVRDIALAVGGLLNPALSGPPVYPPSPEFLYEPPASYGTKTWDEETGENRYRRALYTFRFRSVPYPMLDNFDTPNADAACVRRVRSNTPLQALTSLNETLFMECARGLAMHVLANGTNDHDRLALAFQRCTGRQPTGRELAELQEFLDQQTERFAQPDAKPWELAANDPAKPPELPAGITPPQAAAWTAVSRLLLNLDETITKE
ncbi:MAG: PSD1 and planctomycete cytochrome C domain-containing protein [Pirellulales bacterium]